MSFFVLKFLYLLIPASMSYKDIILLMLKLQYLSVEFLHIRAFKTIFLRTKLVIYLIFFLSHIISMSINQFIM